MLAYGMATLYVREVPADLHRAFKALCATRGCAMRTEILRLIEQELTMSQIADAVDAAGEAVAKGAQQRHDY